MSFLRPDFLWLLLLLPALFVWPRGARRETVHALIRAVVLAFVVFAVAGPVRVQADATTHQVFVVDATESARDGSRKATGKALLTALAALPPETKAHLVGLRFGKKELGRDAARFASIQELERGSSDLGTALLAAAMLVPEGSRGAVTLFSDGLATTRRWATAMQTLTARGLPLHTVALDRPRDDVRPVHLATEGPLQVGQTARVFVDVVGTSADVVVTLADPDGTVAKSARVRVAGRQRIALEFEPKLPGYVRFEATVTVEKGTDARPGNNTIARLWAVQDPIRVLYLGGRVKNSEARTRELLGKGFELDSSTEEGSNEEGAADLSSYDLVMLDDRPAKQVPREFQRKIVAAVTDQGLGLAMTGGAGSFGPGGWHETPIESVLPVDLVQKEEKKDPSTALAIIIDTSGSMGGNRIILAKEVTRLALRRMLPHDKIGIVEFFGNKRWAAPLQSAANAIDIQRALNRLDAGGGTILFPAIEEAYFGLRNVRTRYKHVLVLTDAGVESGPYEQLLRRMARDGICVSTVLVGPGRHSEFLVELADWGRGRFYNASDRFNLPEIMLKQPSSARLPGYRTGTQTVEAQGGRGWWGDVDPRATPAIQGYVETRKRPGADVLVRTKTDRHPVVASWTFGLGRVTAMTTEPTGDGTRDWKDWEGYGPFLGRLLSRTAAGGRVPFHFELERRDATLVLTATRLDRGTTLPAARLADTETRFSFRERAPGVFLATLAFDPGADARILATAAGRTRGERLASIAREDHAPETQVDPLRALDLTAAAAATGGNSSTPTTLPNTAPATGGGGRALRLQHLWPLCLLLALFFYLGDLLWRRRPQRSGAPA